MKNVVTIKLYTNEMDDDYHDMVVDKIYPMLFTKLQAYFKMKETLVFVTYQNSIFPPINTTPFAEVEYTGDLTLQDRKECIDFLVNISGDWECKRGGMTEISQVQLIKFAKISQDDVILIKKRELDLLKEGN